MTTPSTLSARVPLVLNAGDLEASVPFDENDTTCCYALQDKVWVHDPAGVPREVYTVEDENPAGARPATASLEILGDGVCCGSTAEEKAVETSGACCS